jgi:N-dimethylarginine dimethylaminohydrolase
MKPTKTKPEWLAEESSFKQDLGSHWGDWGCDSEVGRLQAVLLRRPGEEIDNIRYPEEYRWLEVMDPVAAREQHDALAEAYQVQGVSVHCVDRMRSDRPNALFIRDNVLMTPEGAVVGRQAMACRRGEERYAAEALARLGVPILHTVCGTGIFETACCLWVDAGTVILGSGNRANYEGCRQLEEILSTIEVENFIYLQIPYGYAHIDSLISFVDETTALFDPSRLPWDVWLALSDLGIRLLEAPSPEETQQLALNLVVLEPGKVLMAAGFPETRTFLESRDISVTEIEVSELRKGWGSLHCMTAVLKREPVGRIL